MSPAPCGETERWWRDEEVSPAAVQALRERVRLFGRQQTQGSDALGIACARFDEQGELLVGASGRTEFQRLYVDYLWVREDLRGQGLGSACLRQIEAQALRRGCVDALIETLSDETAALYEHLGYVCISHVHDFVPGFTRHTLLKVWRSRD